MKNNIFLSLSLLCLTSILQSHQLNNQMLKAADNAGLFDRGIVDILTVRQKIRDLVVGKLIIHGAQMNLAVINEKNQTADKSLWTVIKRPEALFGATYIVLSPEHPNLFSFVTDANFDDVATYVKQAQNRTLLDRHENPNFTIISTGSYAIHPISGEKLPVFVGDYVLENFATRITHAHMAIPAHDNKDFKIAQQNNLPIKLVISSPDTGSSSSPQFNKTTKQLTSAYLGDYNDCIIVNSDFLNGNMKSAAEKAIAFLKSQKNGSEYKEPLLYNLMGKSCSVNDLQAMESLLSQEHKSLTKAQQDMFEIVMIQVQADFLSIVEQFLINAKESKELMIELIEESCALRKNKDAYLLKWAHMNTIDSEKVIFKRDINKFYNLCKFCAEMIDFLGDFGSSCTHALNNLKNIQNNR